MNRLTDERLRALYAPTAERVPERRAACASPEAILALVRRDGAEGERLRTLDHVMSCGACRKDFELLRAVESAGEATGATVAARPVRRFGGLASSPWTWGITAIAASLVLAVGLRHGGPTGTVLRDAAGAEARIGISLIAPNARATAPVHSLTFVWRPSPKTVRYTLEVLDTAGTVAYSASTTDTALVVKDAAKRLKTGVAYRWWVRSLSISGEERHSEFRDLKVKVK